MLSYKSNSPHLDFDSDRKNNNDGLLSSSQDETSKTDSKIRKPLWTYDHDDPMSDGAAAVSFPIMPLPNQIIIGTGGTIADARALMNKIRDMSLYLFRHNDGMRSTHNIHGGSITASMIAKAVADSAQLSTQDANANRMFASSALVVGYDGSHYDKDSASYTIWRCDPTGQFFKCSFGAVGRGAGNAERKIVHEISNWKSSGKGCSQNNGPDKILRLKNKTYNTSLSKLSVEEVKECFESMTFDDALVNACGAILSALGLKPNEKSSVDKTLSGVQGILLPLTNNKSKSAPVEQLHRGILREAFQSALSSL